MTEKTVKTVVVTKATASLKEAVEKELNIPDPDLETAKAALHEDTSKDDPEREDRDTEPGDRGDSD